MKVELQIDEKNDEEKIVIYAKTMNENISEIVQRLSYSENIIKAYEGDEIIFLKLDDIESIYSEEGKIFFKTKEKKFYSKQRLYELENIFISRNFVRISNSEIINFSKVTRLNTKIIGTIEIYLKSGYKTYVSRRYIKKIKEFLGI